MQYILNQLPEYILCQLFCDWLVITDISVLDCALLCRKDNNVQTHLLRLISESSILSPIHSQGICFSPSYWTWLSNRKICVKDLAFDESSLVLFNVMLNQAVANNIILDYCTIEDNVSACWADIDNLKFNSINFLKILNRIEFLSVRSNKMNPSGQQLKEETLISLSTYCTNLKAMNLNISSITAFGLSSIVKLNTHSLKELSLKDCSYLGGDVLSLLPTLLTNLQTLEIFDDKNEEIWFNIIISLNHLRKLSLSAISMYVWRKIQSNLKGLKYLNISIKDNESNDDLIGLFPQSLIELKLRWRFDITDDQHLQNLVSFDQLTNLEELTIFSIFTTSQTTFVSLPSRRLAQITSNTLAQLQFPDSLTDLRMNFGSGIDDLGLITMFTRRNNLPNLKILDLAYNNHIHCEGGLFLLPHRLKYLNLRQCPITPLGTQELLKFKESRPEVMIEGCFTLLSFTSTKPSPFHSMEKIAK
eukprot:gene5299-7362_t